MNFVLSSAWAQTPISGPFIRGSGAAILGQPINRYGDLCFNGTVTAIAPVLAANRIVVGGAFTQVGPCMGSGVPIDLSTGQTPSNFNRKTMEIQGNVNATVSDGSGGWYVGGSFRSVG